MHIYIMSAFQNQLIKGHPSQVVQYNPQSEYFIKFGMQYIRYVLCELIKVWKDKKGKSGLLNPKELEQLKQLQQNLIIYLSYLKTFNIDKKDHKTLQYGGMKVNVSSIVFLGLTLANVVSSAINIVPNHLVDMGKNLRELATTSGGSKLVSSLLNLDGRCESIGHAATMEKLDMSASKERLEDLGEKRKSLVSFKKSYKENEGDMCDLPKIFDSQYTLVKPRYSVNRFTNLDEHDGRSVENFLKEKLVAEYKQWYDMYNVGSIPRDQPLIYTTNYGVSLKVNEGEGHAFVAYLYLDPSLDIGSAAVDEYGLAVIDTNDFLNSMDPTTQFIMADPIFHEMMVSLNPGSEVFMRKNNNPLVSAAFLNNYEGDEYEKKKAYNNFLNNPNSEFGVSWVETNDGLTFENSSFVTKQPVMHPLLGNLGDLTDYFQAHEKYINLATKLRENGYSYIGNMFAGEDPDDVLNTLAKSCDVKRTEMNIESMGGAKRKRKTRRIKKRVSKKKPKSRKYIRR
jgi:hypothetical protein